MKKLKVKSPRYHITFYEGLGYRVYPKRRDAHILFETVDRKYVCCSYLDCENLFKPLKYAEIAANMIGQVLKGHLVIRPITWKQWRDAEKKETK